MVSLGRPELVLKSPRKVKTHQFAAWLTLPKEVNNRAGSEYGRYELLLEKRRTMEEFIAYCLKVTERAKEGF